MKLCGEKRGNPDMKVDMKKKKSQTKSRENKKKANKKQKTSGSSRAPDL